MNTTKRVAVTTLYMNTSEQYFCDAYFNSVTPKLNKLLTKFYTYRSQFRTDCSLVPLTCTIDVATVQQFLSAEELLACGFWPSLKELIVHGNPIIKMCKGKSHAYMYVHENSNAQCQKKEGANPGQLFRAFDMYIYT